MTKNKNSNNVIKIRWEQTNLSNIKKNDDTFFYAFVRAGNLLYLGKSELTTLSYEIKQNLKRLDISNIGLSIWIGYIDHHDTNHKQDRELIDDAESLLIYKNKTQYNDKKTKSYRGILPLKVISIGCPYLMKTITITNLSVLVKN